MGKVEVFQLHIANIVVVRYFHVIETFAALITEAEKYIGYPYVWGGSNPNTSFDCSGFVSWVLTQSGVYFTLLLLLYQTQAETPGVS